MYYPTGFFAIALYLQTPDPDSFVSFLYKLGSSRYGQTLTALLVAVLSAATFRKALIDLINSVLVRFTRELSASHAGPDSVRPVKDILIEAKETAVANNEKLDQSQSILSTLSERIAAIEQGNDAYSRSIQDISTAQTEMSRVIDVHRKTAEEGLKSLRVDVSNIQDVVMSTQTSVQNLTKTLLDEAMKRPRS